MTAKLSVQLVTWNGEKFLPALFGSLRDQTFSDWRLMIWDNGSTDRTRGVIAEQKIELKVPVEIDGKENNIGFAAAHQALYARSDSPYVLILNQDTVLENDVFEKLVAYLDEHEETASAAPLLLRLSEGKKTTIIDSLGLGITRARRIYDRESGKDWEVVTNTVRTSPVPVFGVTGAVAVYRRRAVGEELFDASYFSYQEDIDLAWRLCNQGQAASVLVNAFAYHERGVKAPISGLFGRIKAKLGQPGFVRVCSYRNHLATLIKNDFTQNIILDLPFILWYELKKFVFNLCFDRAALGALKTLFKERGRLMAEREKNLKNSGMNWKRVRAWWSN